MLFGAYIQRINSDLKVAFGTLAPLYAQVILKVWFTDTRVQMIKMKNRRLFR